MSHRMRLFALWAGFLVLVIVQVFELVRERSEIEREVRDETSNYAHLVAEHATGTFRVVELALKTIDKNPDTQRLLVKVLPGSINNYLPAVNHDLQDIVESIQGIDDAFITDASGHMIVSTAQPIPHKTIADQPYYKELQKNTSPAFIIAESIQNKETGKWSIPVLRRIVDD